MVEVVHCKVVAHPKFMLTESEQNLVLEKTRELCTTILAQPNITTIRQSIDSFLTSDASRNQYESLMLKGQELREKQHRALPLSGEEIGEFERQREEVLSNPVTRGFLDAQQALHELRATVTQHITKTLELLRLPTEEDFSQCCGGGGGCGCGNGGGGCGCGCGNGGGNGGGGCGCGGH